MTFPPRIFLRPWRPRCCWSCGEPLEEPAFPLQPRSIVACGPCARLYQAGEPGELIAVIVGDQENGLAGILRDFLRIHVEDAYRPHHNPPAAMAARLERNAA